MVFTDRHEGGINYPKGGVGKIAEKLVSGIEKLGSKVRYKTNVTEIILKNSNFRFAEFMKVSTLGRTQCYMRNIF